MRKAILENKKESVIAKIAARTGLMYAETFKLMEAPAVKTMFSAMSWQNVCSGKQKSFDGISQWFHSRICNEAKSIGEEICRLQIAEKNLLEAKAEFQSVGHSSDITSWIDQVQEALKTARKDNEFIYFEKIPLAEDLTAIEGPAVVKSVPLTSKLLENDVNIFINMIAVDPNAKKSECVIS